mmetsp:Transcript_23783/g.44689  ORF Transcript_23783/g.44689 Transcript_23783/m.44689 type:complete len:233 (-) Transcript_23783:1643-2341(-)
MALIFWFTDTRMAVCPSFSISTKLFSTSPSSSMTRPLIARKDLFPMATSLPSTTHEIPFPVMALKSGGENRSLLPSSFSSQYFTTATARGCSELFSAHPIKYRISSPISARSKKVATSGLPMVRVPVLSKTTAVTLASFSKQSPPLISTPFLAPTPVPTMTAVGAARPSAQGQAMTSVAMANMKLNMSSPSSSYQSFGTAPEYVRAIQTTNVRRLHAKTTGTKTAEMLSANC